MEDTKKILLNSSKSKTSVNKDVLLSIDISSDEKKLPSEGITANIDQYKQYIKEKDKSNKYRFVFTINPVCTNVLYNHITEITQEIGNNVYFYGSASAKTISCQNNKYVRYKYGDITLTGVTRETLIRDTGFSHKDCGNFIYNCGVDIFNNHHFRHDGFVIVNQKKSNTKCENFNTISDLLREYDGSVVKIAINTGETSSHLYNRGTFKSYTDSLRDNLIERDGWFGFINPTGLDIKNFEQNGVSASINKAINNRKACEFIDLYPDRTLFSFMPKKNSRLKREEYNWDYCITYPYKNYDKNKLVSLLDDGNNPILNGILTNFCNKYGNKMSVEEIIGLLSVEERNEFSDVLLCTRIKNNIISGDYLRIHLVAETNNKKKYYTIKSNIKVRTTGIGGYDANYYFSINRGDLVSGLKTILNQCDYENVEITKIYCYIQRISNGRPCKYYFRIFRRLPNFKNSGRYNINKITESTLNKTCLNNFDSSLNKLGFGTNIYGDRMAQIVFNDDVDTTNITDNLGRQLHELFLTIIKVNRGYKKWYFGRNRDYSDPEIEYSHCFGDVSSGLDMPWVYDENDLEDDYNVHKFHDIITSGLPVNDGLIPTSVKKLETGINSGGTQSILGSGVKGVFLGDIVELDELNLEEYILEKIQHRFNTMQREIFYDPLSKEPSTEFKKIMTDDILTDDFDGSFTTETTNLIDNDNYALNLAPEGYYYNAHYRIPIREFSDIVNEGQHTIVKFVSLSSSVVSGKSVISGVTDKNYYFQISDKLYIYDKNNKRHIVTITNVGDDFIHIVFELPSTIAGSVNDCKFFKPNSEMPSTAYDFNDGSGVYRWRDMESFEFINSNSELHDDVFTNGAHYIHKNINFFLRRQDPYGLYGLNPNGNDKFPYEYQLLEQTGNEKDVTPAQHFTDGDIQLC